jgi:hypothetical protein
VFHLTGKIIMSALTKKISTAKIYGKINVRKLPEDGSVLNLYTVIGVAIGTKSGTSDFGDWTSLVGQFEATNMETGERLSSANCFLPDVAQGLVEAQLAQEGTQQVQFAFVIGAKADEGSPVGYSYTAQPVLAPDAKDPLAELRGSVNALALEAPKAKAKK